MKKPPIGPPSTNKPVKRGSEAYLKMQILKGNRLSDMVIEGDDVIQLTEEERVSLRSTLFSTYSDVLDKKFFTAATKEVKALTKQIVKEVEFGFTQIGESKTCE